MGSKKRLGDISKTPVDDKRYHEMLHGWTNFQDDYHQPIDKRPRQASVQNNINVHFQSTDQEDNLDSDNNIFEFHLPDNYDNVDAQIVAFNDAPEDEPVYYSDEEEDLDEIHESEDSDSESEMVVCQFERPKKLNRVEGILTVFMNQIRSNQTDVEATNNAEMVNSGFDPPLIRSTDVRSMRKKVPNAFIPTVEKFFYSRTLKCNSLVGPVINLKKPSPQCNNNHEGCKIENPSICIKIDGSFFCYVPLSVWLRHLVPIWFDQLRLVKNNHSDSGYLHDLCDGDIYKQIVDLNAEYPTLTITLTWDGAETTKQGTKSIWPLLAFLNELPFNIRIHNAMLIALHASTSKPKGDLMFGPLIDELEVLQRDPISIRVNDKEHRFLVKLLLFVADGPARAAALNCGGHNCKYGCHMCDVEFDYDSTYKTPIYQTDSIASIEYLEDSTRRTYVAKALELQAKGKSNEDAHYHGIKGPCELMRLKYLRLSRLFPPEVLHSMYEGNVKSILRHWLELDLISKAWFSSLDDSTKKTYRMRHMLMARSKVIEEADKHLKKIKFPSRALRVMPRLCHRGQFKSMDYELLLFYGPICFNGLIKKESLDNFKLLGMILSKLSARNVQRSELDHVRQLVDKFLKSFDDIYGNEEEKYMWRSNMHHVSHLCDIVQWYGPLFIQSAYFTESLIGVLMKKVVSGTNISQQVFNKYINQFSVLCSVMILAKQLNSSKKFIKNVDRLFPKLSDSSEPITVSKVYDDPVIKSHSKPYDSSSAEARKQGFVPSLLGEEDYSNLLSLKRARWVHPDFGKQEICTDIYNETTAKTTNNHCLKVQVRPRSGQSGQYKYYIVSLILQDADSKRIWIFGKELLNCRKVTLQVFDSAPETEFDYMSYFDSISDDLTLLKPRDFCEFATYCEDVHGLNYVFDIFNRHM